MSFCPDFASRILFSPCHDPILIFHNSYQVPFIDQKNIF
jgi:hypothetical protein